MSKKLGQIEAEEKLLSLGIKFNPFVYSRNTTKVEYYCPECGELKTAQYNNLILGKGIFCKPCASRIQRTLTQEEAEQRLIEFGIEYKPFVYTEIRNKVTIKCEICGEWREAVYQDILKSKNHCKTCSICANKNNTPYTLLDQEVVEDRLEKTGVKTEEFTYDGIYTKVNAFCLKCGEKFETTTRYLYNKGSKLCKRCQYSTSTDENLIKDYIKSLGFEIQENKKMDGIEIDILIPDKKIAFEYNSTYYHSEECGKYSRYHLNKQEKCRKNDITLYHIWEWMWKENEELIKNWIRNTLGASEEHVYARKCEVVEISTNVANDFLEKYHIQGGIISKWNLGLHYNNELVAIMCINNNQYKAENYQIREGEYNIVRFSSKTNVTGGFTKLLKYFQTSVKPDWKIISTYSDNSMSNGDLYSKNGFEIRREIEPNYIYVFKNKQHPKSWGSKKNLIKMFGEKYNLTMNMTEKEMVEKIYNLHKVWDCGKKEWIISNQK